MRKLIKKLEYNYKEETALFAQLDIFINGVFWNHKWRKESEKQVERLRIKEAQQANLSERFNLLESLEIEVTKAKQDTSTRQREINLSK